MTNSLINNNDFILRRARGPKKVKLLCKTSFIEGVSGENMVKQNLLFLKGTFDGSFTAVWLYISACFSLQSSHFYKNLLTNCRTSLWQGARPFLMFLRHFCKDLGSTTWNLRHENFAPGKMRG